MSCVYILDGRHIFTSELALDDFLISKNHLRKNLGDIVFSQSAHRLNAENKLQEAAKIAADVFSKGHGERVWDDDGKTYKYKKPYLGVNKALAMFTDEHGRLLFPVFRPEYYWGENDRNTGRFGDWAQGIYSEDETKLFLEAHILTEENKTIKIADPAQLDKLRALIENKWEHQCLTGDAIHSVYQLFFSRVKDTDGNDVLKDGDYLYNKDLLKTDPSFVDTFKQQLNALTYRRKDGSKIKFTDLMDNYKVDDLIKKCTELEAAIKTKFGENCAYFPEFLITGKMYPIDNCDTLLGYIDLLVVDDKGVPHVLDYKTSVHAKHNDVKVNTYMYLVLTYGRLLSRAGFNIDDTKYCIVPILIADFQYVDTDQYSFSGFNYTNSDIMNDLTYEATQDGVKRRKLDDIVDYEYTVDVTTEDLFEKLSNQMSKWFTDYKAFKIRDDADIKEELEKSDQHPLEADEINKYRYKIGTREIVANSETELIEAVKKFRNNFLPQHKKAITTSVKEGLKEAIKNETVEGITFCKNDKKLGVSSEKLRTELKRYANRFWEVCEGENFKPLEELGIITLYNPTSHQYNFFRVTVSNIEKSFNFANSSHTTLGGNFQSDIYFKSNLNSMMMDATYGNIELIETMLAINEMTNLFNDSVCVGDITVYDPTIGVGVTPGSNYELLSCFNEIEKCGGSESKIEGGNNFINGKIKFASKAQLAGTLMRDIYNIGSELNFEGVYHKFKDYKSCKSQLDTALLHLDKEELIAALEAIIEKLSTGEQGQSLHKILTDNTELSQAHVSLYNQCLLAIAELKGIHFRLQLKDHSNTVDTVMGIFTQGLSGNYIDNPGNLKSDTLNQISKLLFEGYLNIRADIQKPSNKARNFVEALKKRKNFGWLTENTVGNQADLYSNMYDYRDGDVYFKHLDDSSLLEEERDFLDWALIEINNNRFGAARAAQYRLENADEYYRVPLCEGDTANVFSRLGMLNAVKDRLKSWKPSVAYENAKLKAEGLFNDKREEARYEKEENIFEMNNVFDRGERDPDYRKRFVARGRQELNLETLVLKHDFAYISQRRIDEIFPMIKAATVHLAMLGRLANAPFENDLTWCKDYIRNKIKNESIIDPKYREFNELAGKIKNAASKLVLAFSPVQMIYQTIQGIWNDISLIIRKPDGTDAFTLKNMLEAAKIVYSDLGHIGDKPTIIEHINRLYGINDMDMNTYIDKIKTDQNGIFNLDNFLFKFASRPDYYNRMTIFVAKMINEGALKAHTLGKDGSLVYDWEEDGRYKAFANEDHSNEEEYRKAKALYIATAKQFEKENALNEDGTPFKFDINAKTALPRCYTNLESESMKSLSDTIYGYYSHEKKSLIHSTLLGNMYMQFKTFWSGKKNLYLGTKTVKLEGNWRPYTEIDADGNEILYYYQKDAAGNLLFNEPPVREGDPNASDQLVMLWKGNWKEGILATISDIINLHKDVGWAAAWNEKWNNPDPILRNTYRSNLKQLAYDTIMFGIVGNISAAALADMYLAAKTDADKASFIDALRLSAMNIGIKSVKNSFVDFNFLSSIGDPAISWTPFSIEYIGNLVNNVYKTVLGEQNIWDTICRMTSVGTQFKPLFTTIKYNMAQ